MSYYGEYYLYIINEDSDSISRKLLKTQLHNDTIDDWLDRSEDGDGYEDSWPDHDIELLKLSILYPNYVFILDDECIERYSRTFYKSGQMYRWSPVMDRPDYDDSIRHILISPYDIAYRHYSNGKYDEARYMIDVAMRTCNNDIATVERCRSLIGIINTIDTNVDDI